GCELPDVCRVALEEAERFADGQATRKDLKAAEGRIDAWLATGRGGPQGHAASVVATIVAGAPVFTGTIPLQLGWRAHSGESWSGVTEQGQRGLRAEVIGEPFRPVALSPSWLTPQVRALAEAAYEQRDFAALPVLADALEEAGCTEARLLGHCRGKNEHVRG